MIVLTTEETVPQLREMGINFIQAPDKVCGYGHQTPREAEGFTAASARANCMHNSTEQNRGCTWAVPHDVQGHKLSCSVLP